MGQSCEKASQHAQFAEEHWKDIVGKPSFELLSPSVYLISRVVMFVLWVAILVRTAYGEVVEGGRPIGAFYAYLTNISNTVLGIYLGLNVLVIYKANYDESASSETPLLVRVTWGIGALFPALSFLVAALFWILVYPTLNGPVNIWTVLNHGGNAVVALEELFWSRRELHPVQVYVFMLYGVTYSVFTYVYYQLGGTDGFGTRYIYAAVNWENPQSTATLLLAIVLIVCPVLYFIGLGLAALRSWVSDKCNPHRYSAGINVEGSEMKLTLASP